MSGCLGAPGGVRGNVTGNLTGNLTGNVAGGAISGTSLTVTGNSTLGGAGQSLTVNGTVNVFGASGNLPFCQSPFANLFGCPLDTKTTIASDGFVHVEGSSGLCPDDPADGAFFPGVWPTRLFVGDAVRATVYNCGSALVPVRRGEIVSVQGLVPPLRATFFPLGR